MVDHISERIEEIKEMVEHDPMGMLKKISRFQPPSNRWDISDVAFALREIYDRLHEGLSEHGILDEFEVGDESE